MAKRNKAAIKLYWCRGRGEKNIYRRNFGDYLSPLIVEMVSGRPVDFSPVKQADMMSIGTILKREQKLKGWRRLRRLHIWGSGSGVEDECYSERHYYHAVRGKLSRAQLQGNAGHNTALGDPGLLSAQWWSGRPVPTKQYTLGVIPHYHDASHPLMKHLAKQPGVQLIDVFWPVDRVLAAIQSCHFVISSSLHGLIVADAFAVPNRHIQLSDSLISAFKFVDYYTSFDLEEPTILTPDDMTDAAIADPANLIGDYQRPGLNTLQDKLVAAFPSL